MHRFWIMIFFSFDFLHTSKNLFSQKCMYAKTREKEIMTIYLQNLENLFFAWKVGKMCGRTCVVCDHLKNVCAHTLRTHLATHPLLFDRTFWIWLSSKIGSSDILFNW